MDGPPRTVAPGVGRKLKGSFARLVENGKLSLIGVGLEIKDLVEMDLHCIASVLSTVPIATLDHLRWVGGREEGGGGPRPFDQKGSFSGFTNSSFTPKLNF